jgi:competence ComEA-like helix-hairpin-helix protein
MSGLLLAVVLTGVTANYCSAQLQRSEANPGGNWEVLEHCKLLTNAAVDGDSFHVLQKEREYIFRLYFVDAPETDPDLRERMLDQSTYFGISSKDVPRGGQLAKDFTRDRLTAQPFTIVTRWQNAAGRSSLARFYGIVLVNGTRLEKELVRAGLARIYGLRANWPEGSRSTTFINELKNLEIDARQNQRGLWDTNLFPRVTDPSVPTDSPRSQGISPANLLDPNTASAEELQRIKGIGPVLSERIISHRPYVRVDDLETVPGIGPKTLAKVRPYFSIQPAH